MKKFLPFTLFALFVFSIPVAGQHHPFNQDIKKQTIPGSLNIARSIRDLQSLKTNAVLTTQKINEIIKAAQAQAVQPELLDSMRYWDWNSDIGNWVND